MCDVRESFERASESERESMRIDQGLAVVATVVRVCGCVFISGVTST
jgi:hypothetical protein